MSDDDNREDAAEPHAQTWREFWAMEWEDSRHTLPSLWPLPLFLLAATAFAIWNSKESSWQLWVGAISQLLLLAWLLWLRRTRPPN